MAWQRRKVGKSRTHFGTERDRMSASALMNKLGQQSPVSSLSVAFCKRSNCAAGYWWRVRAEILNHSVTRPVCFVPTVRRPPPMMRGGAGGGGVHAMRAPAMPAPAAAEAPPPQPPANRHATMAPPARSRRSGMGCCASAPREDHRRAPPRAPPQQVGDAREVSQSSCADCLDSRLCTVSRPV